MLACWWPTFAEAQGCSHQCPPGGKFQIDSTYVPWAAVDDAGNIHGLDGQQIAVADDGSIGLNSFGPSIAVGDLFGDGKPDLVLADSAGFFWLFRNHGLPNKPAFTQGEIIPIWLGEPGSEASIEGVDNVVPRIQLIDFDHTGKLDIVAGTYSGKFFHIRNLGSTTQEPYLRPSHVHDS